MELLGAWLFFLFGMLRLLLANGSLNKIFTIHDAVKEHNNNGSIQSFNYDSLPNDAKIYSVIHLITLILFTVWVIGGMIRSEVNSTYFMIIFIIHLFSGYISKIAEYSKSLYAVWYTIYWGLFTIFNAFIIESIVNFLK